MAKRVRNDGLLPPASSPGSPEQHWLRGTCATEAEYQRMVSSSDPAPGMPTKRNATKPITKSTLDGVRVVTKSDPEAENLCMEAYVQRVLACVLPGACPEVYWIYKPSEADRLPAVTMTAAEELPGQDVRKWGLTMLIQVADWLQQLAAKGNVFRHGDLHWGNVVRQRKRYVRNRRSGNAIKPLGAHWADAKPKLWCNMHDRFTYQLIDFGMSALTVSRDAERVTLSVPNDFYTDNDCTSHNSEHDLRCLITGMWTGLWTERHGTARFSAIRTRERKPCGYNEWFAWLVKCIVKRAAETSEDYALAIDLYHHNRLMTLLAHNRPGPAAKIHALLECNPELQRLYNFAPSQWAQVWQPDSDDGNFLGHVNMSHTLYDKFVTKQTPIFKPENIVAVCCWAKWQQDKVWHEPGGRKRARPYEYAAFAQFCKEHGM